MRPVVVLGKVAVIVAGINGPGDLVGTYYPVSIPTGFIHHVGALDECFNAFGRFTFSTGINDSGAVTGLYVALDGQVHGFIRVP